MCGDFVVFFRAEVIILIIIQLVKSFKLVYIQRPISYQDSRKGQLN